MRDTIGNISGMTGGYGSTYATAAGQQAYDNYMSQLGDKTMDIYDRVYQQYLNEGQSCITSLEWSITRTALTIAGIGVITVNDYYNDLNYYAGRYDSTYAQDFGVSVQPGCPALGRGIRIQENTGCIGAAELADTV